MTLSLIIMNIFPTITPVMVVAFIIIVVAVGGWYLYEVGKERGRKGK